MTSFEDLKSHWENQTQPEIPNDGAKRIIQKVTTIRKQQQLTNAILSITAMVLIAFFIYVSAYKFQTVMTGLMLMIGVLAIRILLEIKSIKTLKAMNVTQDAERFKLHMIRYYTNRKRVHYVFTPLIILFYCIGFVMLLPSFKASLSQGFYTYIWGSSIVLLVVLGAVILKQIRKELADLKELKR